MPSLRDDQQGRIPPARGCRYPAAPAVAAASGRPLIAFPYQLLLLPLLIDDGVEAVRLFKGPDLAADKEVIRIEGERVPP